MHCGWCFGGRGCICWAFLIYIGEAYLPPPGLEADVQISVSNHSVEFNTCNSRKISKTYGEIDSIDISDIAVTH